MLESRGHSSGYLSVVKQIIDALQLKSGELVLEVGCGSGVLDRWLTKSTTRTNPIIGVDVNRYLLREATALARKEGVEDVITFQSGDAEALPFRENQVDVAFSFTVLEEGNADRMLTELVRVTKPGGRIAVMVRALDIPWVINVPLPDELKRKVQIPHGFVAAEGCADGGLYRRLHEAGLTRVQMFPQFAASNRPDTASTVCPQCDCQYPQPGGNGGLAHGGAQAVADKTYFIAQPFHCAIGTKPEIAR